MSHEYRSHLKSISKNAGIGVFGLVIMNVMAFVNNALITRTIGTNSYGLFILATNILAFIAIIAQLGFGVTIMRFVSYYIGKNELNKVMGTILYGARTLFFSSIAVFVIFFILAPVISNDILNRPGLTSMLRILLFSLPFLVVIEVCISALNGLKLIKFQVIASKILSPLLSFCFISIIFLLGYRLTGLIWVMVMLAIVNAAIVYYFLNKSFLSENRFLEKNVEKSELWQFTWPVYLNAFLSRGTTYIPIFLLGYFLSNSDIGIYNVSFKIALLVNFSLIAFRDIFSPSISSLFATKNTALVEQLFKTTTKWIFTISLISFLIICLFSETLLSIFGPDFSSGKNILLILIFGELVNSSIGLSRSILVLSGRPKVELFNSAIMFTSIFLLCIFLTPVFGIQGTAISYLVTILIINLVRVIELYHFEKMHPFKMSYFKPVVAGIVSFTATAIWIRLIDISPGLEILSGLTLFLALFLTVLAVLKFDSEDKYIIGVISEKIFRGLER